MSPESFIPVYIDEHSSIELDNSPSRWCDVLPHDSNVSTRVIEDNDEAIRAEDAGVVKFATTETFSPDHFYALDLNEIFIDAFPPASTPYFTLSEIDFPSRQDFTSLASIPRSPNSTQHYTIEYYLSYHREAINEYHYYSYYDYEQLFTRGLFTMAEQSTALQFGMAAMSALVFSLRIDINVKPVAFLLYSLALRELQEIVDKNSIDIAESQIAVASAMQLSTFDVYSWSSALIVAFCGR